MNVNLTKKADGRTWVAAFRGVEAEGASPMAAVHALYEKLRHKAPTPSMLRLVEEEE